MKLTGTACTEALNEAEIARRRERAEGNAGGVRVEREVRRAWTSNSCCHLRARIQFDRLDPFQSIWYTNM